LEFINIIKRTQDAALYNDKEVGNDVLSYILEAVKFTPSAANTQPWEVYIIESLETKEALDGYLYYLSSYLFVPLQGYGQIICCRYLRFIWGRPFLPLKM
jgi:nitroreductase